MEYTVTITIETHSDLTVDVLEDLAELGGAAGGTPGGRRADVTLTVAAALPSDALADALERALRAVGRHDITADFVAGEVLTLDEADRRLDVPVFPQLVGIAEIAERLGVSRQRASALQSHADFPAPVARLRSGPVWRLGELDRFADTWERRVGRPPSNVPHPKKSRAARKAARAPKGGGAGAKARARA